MKRMVQCLIVLAALMGGALRAQNITGTWQGTLKAETNQRIVLKIFNEDQRLKGSMYNSAQGALAMRVTSITIHGFSVKFRSCPGAEVSKASSAMTTRRWQACGRKVREPSRCSLHTFLRRHHG